MFVLARQNITRPAIRAVSRSLASVSSSSPPNPNTVGPFQVFDRHAKRLQKDRSVSKDGGEVSRTVDYMREEVADRMMERLLVSVAVIVRGYRLTHSCRISKGNLIPFLTWVQVQATYRKC